MRTILQDLRYTLRQLFKNPGFSLTAIGSLALGIGATTAVFSVIYAILMNPYPYAAPDRMVHMRLWDASNHERGFGLTGTQWQQIRKSPVVEDAFISDDWSLTVTGHDLPEDVQGVYMTSNGFNFVGCPPALGGGWCHRTRSTAKTRSRSPSWDTNSGSGISTPIPEFLARTFSSFGKTTRSSAWGGAAIHMGRRRCLSPVEDHARSCEILLCRGSG